MKYKIITDSSSDLIKKDYQNEDIDFEVIPLTVHIQGREFLDNEELNIKEMLAVMKASKEKATSSCPSPGSYLESMTADYNFVVTITGKLSGSFNSATIAKDMLEDKKAFIIDSKATAGVLELIVMKLQELIRSGLEFDVICEEISKYRDSLNLLFILEKFDNLVKNGRMNKITALVAKIAHICPICQALDGEIKIFKKVRTKRAAVIKLVDSIVEQNLDYTDRTCIISHVFDEDTANELKQLVEEKCSFKNVVVKPMRGLCSFYALENGIIVSY